MRRKIVYVFVIITSLVGVFCLLHFGFGMFHSSDSSSDFDSEGDIAKGDIHLISYGLPSFLLSDKIEEINKGYGFTIQNRGCVCTEEEIKCSDVYNNKIIEHLSIRNGKDWYSRYEKSIDSLEKIVDANFTDSNKPEPRKLMRKQK